MTEADLEQVDAGWDDDEESDPHVDLDAVDAAWADVQAPSRRHRTGEEKAAARRAKALARKQRQRTRAEVTAQKQKRKQGKSRPEKTPDTKEFPPERPKPMAEANPKASPRRWILAGVAFACVIAIAFALVRR